MLIVAASNTLFAVHLKLLYYMTAAVVYVKTMVCQSC